MATFKYTARVRGGKTKSGTMNADSRQALVQSLRKKGMTPVSITQQAGGAGAAAIKRGGGGLSFSFGRLAGPRNKRVKPQQLVLFTRQLATIVSAGLPLMQGLDILASQTDEPNFKLVLEAVGQDVEAGETFSDTLAKYNKIFSDLYTSMIRAGEASGNLDGILTQLASYLEASEELKRKIKSAMTYPVVALAMVLGISTFLILWVVPKFQSIFDSLGGELPKPTLMLIAMSDILNDHFGKVALIIVAATFGIKMYIATSAGHYHLDALKLHIPVFGPLFQKVAISRFTRTFSTLTRSGVPILAALEIVERTAGNDVFAKAIHESQDSVRAGQTLAEPLGASGVFAPMVTRMIDVGEKTGALEALLLKISEFYDSEVDATVEQLTSLIEPLLIGVLGTIVGTIVIALFLPIFKMSSMIN